MQSKLEIILGLKVVNAVFEPEEEGISFESGVNLGIYNKFELSGMALSDAHLLIGKSVINLKEDKETIIINFEGNLSLKIDMRSEAYSGPEALQLRVPGEPIVIWN